MQASGQLWAALGRRKAHPSVLSHRMASAQLPESSSIIWGYFTDQNLPVSGLLGAVARLIEGPFSPLLLLLCTLNLFTPHRRGFFLEARCAIEAGKVTLNVHSTHSTVG